LIGEDFRAADGVSQEQVFQEGVWELWGEGPRGDKKKGPYKAYSSQDRYNIKYWVLEVACDAGGKPQALYKANQKTVCRAYAYLANWSRAVGVQWGIWQESDGLNALSAFFASSSLASD
jgi:hypothetical protein